MVHTAQSAWGWIQKGEGRVDPKQRKDTTPGFCNVSYTVPSMDSSSINKFKT